MLPIGSFRVIKWINTGLIVSFSMTLIGCAGTNCSGRYLLDPDRPMSSSSVTITEENYIQVCRGGTSGRPDAPSLARDSRSGNIVNVGRACSAFLECRRSGNLVSTNFVGHFFGNVFAFTIALLLIVGGGVALVGGVESKIGERLADRKRAIVSA